MNCELCYNCPRACGVDRTVTHGFCGAGALPVVAYSAPHFDEEPCISGKNGTGAVFFGGCSLHCVYCQNASISRTPVGKQTTVPELRKIFVSLAESGVHSIDLVTPTHFADSVAKALDGLTLPVPVIYNCGGYESVSMLRRLRGKIQIYLPDYKYALSQTAERYSGAADYPDTAGAALLEMYRQVGRCKTDKDGMLISGMLIRHLVLPGNLENTFAIIDFIKDNFPSGSVLFSLMSQYTPVCDLSHFPEIDRRLTGEEYNAACEYLKNSNITDGYLQELASADEKYIPPFGF